MTPDQLRRLFADAAEPVWDDDVRASAALFRGKRQRRNRLRREAIALVGTTGVAVAALGVILVPTTSDPSTNVVLGCARGIGTSGAGLVAAGVAGVTLSVTNPTHQVLAVVSGRSMAFALPGATQVTLPIPPGRATVQCGSGAPVALTVQDLSVESHCSSDDTVLTAAVQRGQLDQLTRAELGSLPNGAVVDTPASTGAPLERVQVRSAGRVLAEAVWHAMPGAGTWQLESLSRCS